jgi:hypothetical protein
LASKMLCVHEGSRDHVANTRNDLGRHTATQVTLRTWVNQRLKKQMQLEI